MRLISKLVGTSLILVSASTSLPIRLLAKVETAKQESGRILAGNCGGSSCTMSRSRG